MARAKSAATKPAATKPAATKPAVKKPVKRPVAKQPVQPQIEYYAEVQLAHGAGYETIYISTKKQLDRFIRDVTKRNLNQYPMELIDAAGNLFIIRSFLFAKVVVKES